MRINNIKINIYELLCKVLFLLFLLTFVLFGSNVVTNNIDKIFGILFCLFEFLYILRKGKIKFPPYVKYLIIFLCYILMTSLLYFKSSSGINLSIYIFLYIGVSFMGYNFFTSIENGREKLLNIIIINGILIVIYVIFYYGVTGYFQLLLSGQRVGNEINNVNLIGLNTIISALASFYKFMINGAKKYLLSIIPLIIVSLGTGSKKVIIMMILGIISITLLKYKGKITKNSIIKFMVTIGIIICVFVLLSKISVFNTVFTRFYDFSESIFKSGKFDSENMIREEFIQYGFDVFLKNPILGIGLGNSSIVLKSKFNYSTYFHNNYIELLSTTGIIGTLLFYLSYFISIKFNTKEITKNKNDNFSYLCLILIMIELIIEYGMVSLESPYIYIYLILFNIQTFNRKEKKI